MNALLYKSLLLVLTTILVLVKAGYSQEVNITEQLKSGKELTNKALVLHDKDRLLKAHDMFKEILKTDSSNSSALYGLTFTGYKLLEFSLQKGNESLFDIFYQPAIDNANRLISSDKYLSEGKSLLSGIYMMKIANSPMSAVTLSSEINGLLDEAEKADPKNPVSFIVRGEMKYNTPKLFGGSPEDAVKNFNKAVALCEENPDTGIVDTRWASLESLAWLGRAFVKLENYDAAKFAYQKALNIQPDFGWVKYVLLPEVEKKVQN
jgi:tetratricopeptide (TPR) repeat protein